jgi:hypothetical protein
MDPALGRSVEILVKLRGCRCKPNSQVVNLERHLIGLHDDTDAGDEQSRHGDGQELLRTGRPSEHARPEIL